MRREIPEDAREKIERELAAWRVKQETARRKHVDAALVRFRKAVDRATAKNCWYDGWKRKGDLADYSGLEKPVSELILEACVDELKTACDYLLEKAIRQGEHSNDDGDCLGQARYWMRKLVRAIMKAEEDEVGLLVWAAEFQKKDPYYVGDTVALIWKGRREYPREIWGRVVKKIRDPELIGIARRNASSEEDRDKEEYDELQPRVKAVAAGDLRAAAEIDKAAFEQCPDKRTYRDAFDASAVIGESEAFREYAYRLLETRGEFMTLVEICLMEHRLEDAVRHYAQYMEKTDHGNSRYGSYDFDFKAAERIARYNPPAAIAILGKIIEWNSSADDIAYSNIGRALAEMKPLMVGINKRREYSALVADLIQKYPKRPNLLEILRRSR